MMDTDPSTVEAQSQAERENYKVYKRRWLVLLAMFSVNLVVGLHRCLISITDILDDYMGVTIKDYDLMTQVSMWTILVSVLAMARALDHFGLRRITYVACLMVVCANGLKALCCANERYVGAWIKAHRFDILLLSEVFVGFVSSIASCVPAKVASSWFAHYENTLALVIAGCGYNVGIGFSNFFTPVFIKNAADMYKMSYMFLVTSIAVTCIILTCVTRSSPKLPPSSSATMSASTAVPLKSGLIVMMTNRNFILVLVTFTFNLALTGVVQMNQEDILRTQGYPDSFCGALIAHSYFFGTFFTLMGAAWIDNSANYVRVSRISSLICALSIATFNISVMIPNIRDVIMATNVMASFGCSLMYPALFQVCIRCATSILPEATVSAVVIVGQQILMGILMNSLTPLKKLSPRPDGYQAPMIIFACVAMTVNSLYFSSFKAPSRDQLQARLRDLGSRTLQVDESMESESSLGDRS